MSNKSQTIHDLLENNQGVLFAISIFIFIAVDNAKDPNTISISAISAVLSIYLISLLIHKQYMHDKSDLILLSLLLLFLAVFDVWAITTYSKIQFLFIVLIVLAHLILFPVFLMYNKFRKSNKLKTFFSRFKT